MKGALKILNGQTLCALVTFKQAVGGTSSKLNYTFFGAKKFVQKINNLRKLKLK